MQWLKHDTSANQDAKLQEVLLDYGLEGYGLYWYCLELIAGKVDKDNVTFQLEHDARIIARNTGSTPKKVEEMMTRFVDLGLFERGAGIITCYKLAIRLDKSMTSNPKMRELIGSIKNNHDGVMIESCKSRLDKIRVDKSRLDNKTPSPETIGVSDLVNDLDDLVNPTTPTVEKKPKSVKKQLWTSEHKEIAVIMSNPVISNFPTMKINLDEWSENVRKLMEIDKRTREQILNLWAAIQTWQGGNGFTWTANCRTPAKLRQRKDGMQYFEIISLQVFTTNQARPVQQRQTRGAEICANVFRKGGNTYEQR